MTLCTATEWDIWGALLSPAYVVYDGKLRIRSAITGMSTYTACCSSEQAKQDKSAQPDKTERQSAGNGLGESYSNKDAKICLPNYIDCTRKFLIAQITKFTINYRP